MTQRILITAGASGIGREIALAFAANGAHVAVCDIDDDALQALKQELPSVHIFTWAMAAQSIKRLVNPRDIGALAVFLDSDAGKSISAQRLPIDNDMQSTT